MSWGQNSPGDQEQLVLAITLLLLAYTWAGYPMLLLLLRRLAARGIAREGRQTSAKISIVIAVRNEEETIAEKLVDCTNLDYPSDQLEIVVVSDRSTDGTEEIVRGLASRDARILLLAGHGQLGKSGAQNLGVQHATGEILFFTDAATRTRPDALTVLMENFADSRVGLVTADVYLGQPGSAVAEGQGIYWRFELFLRKLESELRYPGDGQRSIADDAPVPLPSSSRDLWR